jgi:hypothetical protein
MNKGEIIELQKIHYGVSSVSELLDRSFNEITKTRDNITPENFFNLYSQLFYDIPKDGKNSHTFLIEESTDYIGGYEDPKGEKVNSLIDRVIELETSIIENPGENSLFTNGTALYSNWRIGIMQEGRLREVANEGDPNPWTQIKKLLGKIDTDGKILDDPKAWVEVSEETWDSIPHWPAGTIIKDKSDWNLSLKSFEIATSNITVLTENIESSELDSFEIKKLIGKLQDKTPFEGYTIEDNWNGTITYSDNDLLPFNFEGTYEGQERQFYTGEGIDGRLASNTSLDFKDAIKSIIEYWEARDNKGMYGLGDWDEETDLGHTTPYEVQRRHNKNESEAYKALLKECEEEDDEEGDEIEECAEDYIKDHGSAQAAATFLELSYPKLTLHPDTHEYGTDWKSWMIENLEKLKWEINEGKFKWYHWGVDFERSYNQELIDGRKIFNGKYYWVDIYQGRSEWGVRRWAAGLVQEAIEEQKAFYSTHGRLVTIERIIRG